jgi:hypothetical protein
MYVIENSIKLQHQILVVCGGMLTLFVSVAANNSAAFVQRSFAYFGLSILFGIISICFWYIHLIVAAEVSEIIAELVGQNSAASEKVVKGIKIIANIIHKEIFSIGWFVFFVLQTLTILLAVSRLTYYLFLK